MATSGCIISWAREPVSSLRGSYPADPGQILPVLLFLDLGLFAQSDVPVAGPDADVLPGRVGNGLADMFDPTDCAIGPLTRELAFPDSRLFHSQSCPSHRSLIPRHDYFPEEIGAPDESFRLVT